MIRRTTRVDPLGRWRPEVSVEWLTALICVYLAAVFNSAFWQAALAGRAPDEVSTWRLLLGTFIALCALHFAAFACVANRWTVKPLLSALVVMSAMAAYYMDHYAVFMDPDMLFSSRRSSPPINASQVV